MRAELASLNPCAVPFLAAPPSTCSGTTIQVIHVMSTIFIFLDNNC